MITLRIEHFVSDYDGWKRAFDGDPVGRRGKGVRNYRIYRAADDPSLVLIDLEFDDLEHAQGLLDAMKHVWAGPGRDVMRNPVGRIIETIEMVSL
ncbi:MAG: hypothetical protein ABR584_06080 [Candidatus Baltobacteraceae bacterium]